MATSYNKQTWVDNTTVVDASHLNHIEDGIDAVSTAIDGIGDVTESGGATTLDITADTVTVANGLTASDDIVVSDSYDNTTTVSSANITIHDEGTGVDTVYRRGGVVYDGITLLEYSSSTLTDNGNLVVNDVATFNGTVTIEDELTVNDYAYFNTDVRCYQDLTVDSYTYHNEDVEIGDSSTELGLYINSLPVVAVAENAGAHNAIYRGKYLGDTYTDAQKTAIRNGKFTDLYIGDYWTIGGVNYRIAAFDYYLNTGDTACTDHHIVIVPDTALATGKMNNTNITTGAYVGSDFYTGNNSNTAKATAISTIESAFGSGYILSHRNNFGNATSNGYTSGTVWTDSKVDLMTEQNVYGCKIFGDVMNGTASPAAYSLDRSVFPLFMLNPALLTNGQTWWLRDVASTQYFSLVGNNGLCSCYVAGNSYGFRPAFCLYGGTAS